jgi:hypothetical protein
MRVKLRFYPIQHEPERELGFLFTPVSPETDLWFEFLGSSPAEDAVPAVNND